MKQFEKTKRVFMLILLVLWSAAPWTTAAMAQQASQKNVTLNMKSANVKDFFSEVTKQTGLNFICKSDLANQLPKVTVQATNKPVRQVLSTVFSQLGCNYEIEDNFVTVTKKQSGGGGTRQVKGVVRDADGELLIGVPVSIGDGRV
ncbi:MAG: STN domain-containing protein, partial [Prevotella sp.]|nr:STN domain-containing protein [Prevotella sp.]